MKQENHHPAIVDAIRTPGNALTLTIHHHCCCCQAFLCPKIWTVLQDTIHPLQYLIVKVHEIPLHLLTVAGLYWARGEIFNLNEPSDR